MESTKNRTIDEVAQETGEVSEEEVYKWLIFHIIIWKQLDFAKSWSEFSEEIKSKTRFHVTHPVVNECADFIDKHLFFLPKRTTLYRAGKGRPHLLSDAIHNVMPSWEEILNIDTPEPDGRRNEALDCRVYAYAALHGLFSMGLNLNKRTAALPPVPLRRQSEGVFFAPVAESPRRRRRAISSNYV